MSKIRNLIIIWVFFLTVVCIGHAHAELNHDGRYAVAKIDLVDLVDDKTREDEKKISSDDRDTAIAGAVRRYSKDRPRIVVEDLVAAGGNSLVMPAEWVTNFSALRSLEFPIGNVPPTVMSPADWQIYRSPTGEEILTKYKFSSGDQVRATHTARHILTDTQDTIALGDQDAVACWAAALLCDQLATHYSGDSDSTIKADTVEHGQKSERFAKRAAALRKLYYTELGIDARRNQAASAVVDLDGRDSLGGGRLYHRNR